MVKGKREIDSFYVFFSVDLVLYLSKNVDLFETETNKIFTLFTFL